MNELALVAVMKYRLPPTTDTCNVRKCQTSGQLLKVDHNTNTETVSGKQLVLSAVNLIEFPNTSGDWGRPQNMPEFRAVELSRALRLKVIQDWVVGVGGSKLSDLWELAARQVYLHYLLLWNCRALILINLPQPAWQVCICLSHRRLVNQSRDINTKPEPDDMTNCHFLQCRGEERLGEQQDDVGEISLYLIRQN